MRKPKFFRPRRGVPHRLLADNIIHLIYRLNGCVSRKTRQEMSQAIAGIRKTIMGIPEEEWKDDLKDGWLRWRRMHLNLLQQKMEVGPFWLKPKECKEIVTQSWLFIEKNSSIKVHCCCVMGNHVHLVVSNEEKEPINLSSVLGRHKSFTAKLINRIHQREGQLWENDFFDRDIRKGKYAQTIRYVLNNPVKAGLCSEWEEYNGNYLAEDVRAFIENFSFKKIKTTN